MDRERISSAARFRVLGFKPACNHVTTRKGRPVIKEKTKSLLGFKPACTEVSMLFKDAEETPEGEAHSFFIYALDRLRQRLSPVGKHRPDSGEDPRHGEDLRKKQNTYVVLATHAQQAEGEDEQTEAVIDEDFPSVPSEMPSEWDVLPGRESKEFELAMQALSLLLDLHKLSVMVSNEWANVAADPAGFLKASAVTQACIDHAGRLAAALQVHHPEVKSFEHLLDKACQLFRLGSKEDESKRGLRVGDCQCLE